MTGSRDGLYDANVFQEEAAVAMKNVLNAIKLQDRGVYVQASTLGSLEALLEFLKQSKIPVSSLGHAGRAPMLLDIVILSVTSCSQWSRMLFDFGNVKGGGYMSGRGKGCAHEYVCDC